MNGDTVRATLAEPFDLPCGVRLKNRIGKSAMTEQLADPDNAPTEEHLRLYRRWSEGGAGLLVTGNVMVDRRALEGPRNVVLEDERDLPILSRWAEEGQQEGCALWMQINHPGRQTPTGVSEQTVAPSAVKLQRLGFFFSEPRELEIAEIEEIIDRYAATAALAKRAGFGGVQVHGAHGYLCAQFLSPITNRRSDRWGGSSSNRRRFLLEIVRRVRAAVGADYPVSVKLNSNDFQKGGYTVDHAVEVATALEAEALDLLELSGGTYENPAMVMGAERVAELARREAYFLDYAAKIRDATSLPLMLTGGLRSAAAMAEIIADGTVDLAGLARPLAVEPDLPKRILTGETDRARPIPVTLHNRTLDSMLTTFWHVEQIHRIAAGGDPVPGLSRIGALLRGLARPLGKRVGR
jgi:2,4-dienoyl-CoA reductase-like NADH-dependent reductase (Old Yellow Enzyme family)